MVDIWKSNYQWIEWWNDNHRNNKRTEHNVKDQWHYDWTSPKLSKTLESTESPEKDANK